MPPRKKSPSEEKKGGAPDRGNACTEELTDEFCLRLAEGRSLTSVCMDDDMPHKSTVLRWVAKDEGFRKKYELAKEFSADAIAEECLDIADDGTNDYMEIERKGGKKDIVLNHEHVQRSKLRIDTRLSLIKNWAPKKYGQRVHSVMTGADGGPIETRELSDMEIARRLVSVLDRVTKDQGA